MTAAAGAAALRWGAGSTGSRLVTGSTELHAELEAELAGFCGFEAALVFSSGYAANLAAVTALTGRDAVIVADAGNHASLIDGCRLSRAEVAVAPHADPEAVDKAFDQCAAPAAGPWPSPTRSSPWTGTRPRWRARRRVPGHGAALLMDDAHGLGCWAGRARRVGRRRLAGAPDMVVTVTLSKALGSQGGAVLGSARVVQHLVNTARTFIFDTGLNPAAAGAALPRCGCCAGTRRAARAGGRRRVARAADGGGLSAVRPDAAVVSVRAPRRSGRCGGRRSAGPRGRRGLLPAAVGDRRVSRLRLRPART
ncbi:aminotransferase class I/II-fold pyridoxal phosphate-dependent enzyme [Streptomyces sp. M19]